MKISNIKLKRVSLKTHRKNFSIKKTSKKSALKGQKTLSRRGASFRVGSKGYNFASQPQKKKVWDIPDEKVELNTEIHTEGNVELKDLGKKMANSNKKGNDLYKLESTLNGSMYEGFTKIPLYQPFVNLKLEDSTSLLNDSSKLTTLPNGIKVISSEHNRHLGQIAVTVDSGFRDELPSQSGMMRFINEMTFGDTKKISSYAQMREFELRSVKYSAVPTPDYWTHTTTGLPEFTPFILDVLSANINQSEYVDWQVTETALHQLKTVNPTIHKNIEYSMDQKVLPTAFKLNTIGNSKLMNDDTIYTKETAEAFLGSNVSKLQVVGTGIDHNKLVDNVVESFGDYQFGNKKRTAAKYTGGHGVHTIPSSSNVRLFVGFESAPFGQGKIMSDILTKIYQTQQHKYKKQNSITSNLKKFGLSSVTVRAEQFEDTGIFGLVAEVPKELASLGTVGLLDTLNQINGLTQEDIEAAKTATITSYSKAATNPKNILDLNEEVFYTGKLTTTTEKIASVKKLTKADMVNAVKSMLNTDLTYVTVGNVDYAPRWDELQKYKSEVVASFGKSPTNPEQKSQQLI